MEILHEINLARFWKLFLSYKKTFIIVWIATAAWALMIGFSIPRTYMSEVKLAPEASNTPDIGALGSIGSMMGLKMGGLTGDDAIVPTLYPDVLQSPDFMLDVLNIKVSTKDGKIKNMPYKTYLTKHCKAEWWNAGMAWIVRKILPPKKEKSIYPSKDGQGSQLIMLSKEDGELLKLLKSCIDCSTDKKTDVISIQVVDQDPLVATILVDSISERLQTFITNYRTKKARVELKNIQNLHNKAYAEYQKAQKEYAQFADTHTDLVLNEYKVKEEYLENDMQLKFNVYSQLSAQLHATEAKVMQRTPVYTTIQAAMVPYKHIAPKKLTILLLYLILSTFGCFVWVYYKDRKKEEKQHSPLTE